MRKIKIEKGKLNLLDDIEGVYEKTITKFGSGAKIDAPKEHLGKRVYVQGKENERVHEYRISLCCPDRDMPGNETGEKKDGVGAVECKRPDGGNKVQFTPEQQAEIERGVQSDPLVQAVLNRFPGAKIVGVTQNPLEGGEGAPDASLDGERED